MSPAGLGGRFLCSAASSGLGGASVEHAFGLQFATVSTQNVTPNYTLQRTAPRVTLAAPRRPTTQPARRAPQSLSLGSLGALPTSPVNREIPR